MIRDAQVDRAQHHDRLHQMVSFLLIATFVPVACTERVSAYLRSLVM